MVIDKLKFGIGDWQLGEEKKKKKKKKGRVVGSCGSFLSL